MAGTQHYCALQPRIFPPCSTHPLTHLHQSRPECHFLKLFWPLWRQDVLGFCFSVSVFGKWARKQLNISIATFTTNNNNNNDQLLLLLLPEFSQSSSSASSVSLWTTTLVTDMSGCCSLASLMAWARACRTMRQPHSGNTEHSRQCRRWGRERKWC